jgi:hypothetical protein
MIPQGLGELLPKKTVWGTKDEVSPEAIADVGSQSASFTLGIDGKGQAVD